MSDNLSELLGKKGLKDNLFDKLGKLAKPEGAPSEEAMAKLANEFLIGKANAFGTARFYDFLNTENKGEKANVLHSTDWSSSSKQTKVTH